MNAGRQAVEWLYKNQLQVDEQWSVKTESGFTWWPYQHAQTITTTDEVKGPDGTPGAFVGVRTQVLRDLDLTDQLAIGINELAREGADTMSGLVYDETKRGLDLCSMVPVHDDTRDWMQRLISIAAVLQIAESAAFVSVLLEHYHVGGVEATSGHPTSGERSTPDEVAGILQSLIVPMGAAACAWTPEEFSDAVDQFMQEPPALLATSGDSGFTVEFPFGDASSLCQADCNMHAAFGNGLRVTQSFPVPDLGDVDGAKSALLLNRLELAGTPMGYGFGTYFYQDRTLCFSTFFPNFTHAPGLLPNLYFAAAQRARALSALLANKEWDEHSFDAGQSAVGRLVQRELHAQEVPPDAHLAEATDSPIPAVRTRQAEAQEQVETCKARRKLVYKVEAYAGEEVIYASPERAAFHSRVKHALEDSGTWSEFRQAMPRKEYSRLVREIFDDNDEPRPHGSDAFSMDQIPGASDCDYPGWLQQEMLHGVLPEDIVQKYGTVGFSYVSGECLIINSADLEEVNAELEKQGYELIDGSGLYLEG